MDRRTDGQTGGRTDGPTDQWTELQTLLYICEDASKSAVRVLVCKKYKKKVKKFFFTKTFLAIISGLLNFERTANMSALPMVKAFFKIAKQMVYNDLAMVQIRTTCRDILREIDVGDIACCDSWRGTIKFYMAHYSLSAEEIVEMAEIARKKLRKVTDLEGEKPIYILLDSDQEDDQVTDGNYPLCSIGHCDFLVRCPRG